MLERLERQKRQQSPERQQRFGGTGQAGETREIGEVEDTDYGRVVGATAATEDKEESGEFIFLCMVYSLLLCK